MSIWGQRLREVRQNYKLTQHDLAKILDMDVTAISRYERGGGAKQMPIKVKDKLLKVFQLEEIHYIDLGELVSWPKSATDEQKITYNIETIGRDNNAGPISGDQTINNKSGNDLSLDEQQIIDYYRRISEDQKEEIFILLRRMFRNGK